MLNKIVRKLAFVPVIAALTMVLSPSEAKTSPSPDAESSRAAVAQAGDPAAAAAGLAPLRAIYTSADPACATARRRFWTEAGWVVRRVTVCR